MVISVSFQKRVPPGAAGSRGSLAELMAKQKALADSRGEIMQQETPTIMQGLGKTAQIMANAWGERQAMNQETAGRERLAAIRAGIDLDKGPTSQQIADAGLLDEDYSRELQKQAIDARRLAQERELKVMDRDEQRKYEDTRETRINERELGEETAAQQAQREEAERVRQSGIEDEATRNTRELAEEEIRLKAQREEAERIRLAGVEGGKETILSGPEAEAQGAKPGERVKINAEGKKEIIKETPVETFDAPTPQDIANFNLGPAIAKGASFKVKVTNGIREPVQIGTAPQDTTPSGEIAGRLGLMTDFFKKHDDLAKEIAAGGVSGLVNTAAIQSGAPTRATEIVREIATGAEALVRNLTGAGMPESEARTYVQRYQPTLWSALGPDEAVSKFRELNEDMWNVYTAVSQNRRWTDDPAVFKLRKEREENAANPANPNAPADAAGGLPAMEPGDKEGDTGSDEHGKLKVINGKWTRI